VPILTFTTRLDFWHTTALPYCNPMTSPLSPTKHLISTERAGPVDATSVALPLTTRRHALMVASSYFFESAASSSELMAALSWAAVESVVVMVASFSEPMKNGDELSWSTMNFTSAAAETVEVKRAAVAAPSNKIKSCAQRSRISEASGYELC